MTPIAEDFSAGTAANPTLAKPGASGLWQRLFGDLGRGAPRALEALYDAAAGTIFGLALWRTGSVEDANDVVQDVFLRLLELRGRWPEIGDPRAWLLTVAHHKAVDAARRRRRRQAEPLEQALLMPIGVDEVRRLDAERASRFLARLPAAQREAIYLRHFADCTFAAIGKIVGVPTFTAASRYRLGIRALRRLMEAES